MCLKIYFKYCIKNQHGFGLIAAIFVVVILAVFGLLVARFTGTGSVQSAEDYLWAQALYSARSAANLRMLNDDSGGPWSGPNLTIAGFTTNELTYTTPTAPDIHYILRVSASRASVNGNVERILEAKYVL